MTDDNTFEFSGVVNKKDLSREMSALYRHCLESKEQLVNQMLDDPVRNYGHFIYIFNLFSFVFILFYFVFNQFLFADQLLPSFFQDLKLNELFRLLQVLEKRQNEHERKALEYARNNPVMQRPSISLTGIQE